MVLGTLPPILSTSPHQEDIYKSRSYSRHSSPATSPGRCSQSHPWESTQHDPLEPTPLFVLPFISCLLYQVLKAQRPCPTATKPCVSPGPPLPPCAHAAAPVARSIEDRPLHPQLSAAGRCQLLTSQFKA